MNEYSKQPHDLSGIKATAEKYGFCIVKHFFSPQRMEEMESLMAEAKASGVAHDLMSIDTLRPVLLDPRLISIAKALLGQQLVYYGETAMNYEREAGSLTANPFRVLHADARGTPGEEIDLYIKWRAHRALDAKMDEADYYAFDREQVISEAAAHGVSMRFDKIIAAAKVRGNQQDRVKALMAKNTEYSPHHSITA